MDGNRQGMLCVSTNSVKINKSPYQANYNNIQETLITKRSYGILCLRLVPSTEGGQLAGESNMFLYVPIPK